MARKRHSRRSPPGDAARDEAVGAVPRRRTWHDKFRDALRGCRRGIRGQSSFFVHFFAAAAVVAAGVALEVDLVQWCLLALCIAGVLAAEMFNSALEHLARAVKRDRDAELGLALDIGSGAVLLAAAGAATVGAIVFGHRLGVLVGWWG
jgi:diacylglycerol kinase